MLRRLALCALALVAMPATAQEDGAGVIELPPDVPGEARLVGPITPTTGDELRAALEQPAGVLVLVLDSPGGSITGALAMAALVREAGVAAYVPRDGSCDGACALVFIAAAERASAGGLTFSLPPGSPEEQAAARDFIAGLGLMPGIVRIFASATPSVMDRYALVTTGLGTPGARLAPRLELVAASNRTDFYQSMIDLLGTESFASYFRLQGLNPVSVEDGRSEIIAGVHQTIAMHPAFPAALLARYASEGIRPPDLDTRPSAILPATVPLFGDLVLGGALRLPPDDMANFLALMGGFMTWVATADSSACEAAMGLNGEFAFLWEPFATYVLTDADLTAAFADLAVRAAEAELDDAPLSPEGDQFTATIQTWRIAVNIARLGEESGLRPGPPVPGGPDPGGPCRRLGVVFELFDALPEPEQAAAVFLAIDSLRELELAWTVQ